MNKKGLKNIKKCLVSSFLALLMLASCTENASKNNSYQTGENDNLNENFERVDFDKVLRNLTKGFDEIYNDSVKVTSAIPDAKLRNQEITVIIELDKETALEEYFDSGFDTYSNYYKSKQGIEYENQLVKDQ